MCQKCMFSKQNVIMKCLMIHVVKESIILRYDKSYWSVKKWNVLRLYVYQRKYHTEMC